MIEEIFGHHWYFLLLCTYCAEIILFLYVNDYLYGKSSQKNLVRRINGYAFLSFGPSENPGVGSPSALTTCSVVNKYSHQILLGTLKKVEQKNSTLLTILVFLEGAFLSVYYQPGDWTVDGQVIAWAAFAALPALFGSLMGTRHVDLGHFGDFPALSIEEIAKKLQLDLLDDLEMKELAFKFSWYVTLGTLIILFATLLTRSN